MFCRCWGGIPSETLSTHGFRCVISCLWTLEVDLCCDSTVFIVKLHMGLCVAAIPLCLLSLWSLEFYLYWYFTFSYCQYCKLIPSPVEIRSSENKHILILLNIYHFPYHNLMIHAKLGAFFTINETTNRRERPWWENTDINVRIINEHTLHTLVKYVSAIRRSLAY